MSSDSTAKWDIDANIEIQERLWDHKVPRVVLANNRRTDELSSIHTGGWDTIIYEWRKAHANPIDASN